MHKELELCNIILIAFKMKKKPYQFYTPLYKKDIKENQNRSMETTLKFLRCTSESSLLGRQTTLPK